CLHGHACLLPLIVRHIKAINLYLDTWKKFRIGFALFTAWGATKMKSVIRRYAKSGLARAAAMAVAIGLLGLSSLAITTITPAQASCRVGGEIRNDIAARDCLEATQTGCVRHMLTDEQYMRCLRDNKQALDEGRTCVINGKVRNDLSSVD